MSVDVSTCKGCDFNTAMSVVSRLWQEQEICVHICCCEISNQYLEQRINTNFACNTESASEKCAVPSQAPGIKVIKKLAVFEWHKWFRGS
jgi:hypothetical protein